MCKRVCIVLRPSVPRRKRSGCTPHAGVACYTPAELIRYYATDKEKVNELRDSSFSCLLFFFFCHPICKWLLCFVCVMNVEKRTKKYQSDISGTLSLIDVLLGDQRETGIFFLFFFSVAVFIISTTRGITSIMNQKRGGRSIVIYYCVYAPLPQWVNQPQHRRYNLEGCFPHSRRSVTRKSPVREICPIEASERNQFVELGGS